MRIPGPSITAAVVEVTTACNLRCSHCCASAGAPRSEELSTDRLVGVFEDLSRMGCSRVSLTGGEPLVRPDWLELVQAASRLGMRVGLMTNGTLFTDREAEAARDAGLISLGFSVDGVGEAHDRARGTMGTFEEVRRGMGAAREAGLKIGAVTQINRANVGELERIGEFLAAEGASAWRVQLGQPMGRMSEIPFKILGASDLPPLAKRLVGLLDNQPTRLVAGHSLSLAMPASANGLSGKAGAVRGGCPAGDTVLSILSGGDVVGCPTIAAVLPTEFAVVGNVKERSLEEIWDRGRCFDDYRQALRSLLGGECATCRSLDTCLGGCPGSWVEVGDGYENAQCARFLRARSTVSDNRVGNLITAAAFVANCALFLSFAACEEPEQFTVACPDCDTDTDTDSDTDTDTDTGTDTGTDTDTDTDPDVDAGADGGPDSGTDVDGGPDSGAGADAGTTDGGMDGGK